MSPSRLLPPVTSRTNWQHFFMTVDFVLQETNEEKLRLILSSIPEENRLRMAQIFGPDPTKWEWNRVRDFMSCTQSYLPAGEALRRLGQRKQRPDETPEEFLAELRILIHQIGCADIDVMLSSFFVLGLTDEFTAKKVQELWHREACIDDLLAAAQTFQSASR
ncbi:unnamed protein product [Dimorphilus gyrociliatus]|uniref:Uncharacterized protein n=1 Tax=Dimorphilus gyrociliatus TaxID=2664684 RepID=A0A7I8WBE0_9ANNE|nr:unnamed protein product [Dimorphilus gyrociliatus]